MQISQDPRYTALPERRCRQLFNQYHSTLKDLQSAPATAPSSSSTPPEAAASSSPATASSSASGDQSPLSVEEEQAGEVALRLGRLSEKLAASALQQPSSEEEQQRGPGQGLAALTQPNGAQVPRAGDMSNKGQQSGVQLDALEALRQEQARLKAEYDRMEVGHSCTRGCVCVCECLWSCHVMLAR